MSLQHGLTENNLNPLKLKESITRWLKSTRHYSHQFINWQWHDTCDLSDILFLIISIECLHIIYVVSKLGEIKEHVEMYAAAFVKLS